MMENFTEREQVVETINRLFYHTEHRQWEKLIKEVFSGKVILDMTSLGAPSVETLTGKQICKFEITILRSYKKRWSEFE